MLALYSRLERKVWGLRTVFVESVLGRHRSTHRSGGDERQRLSQTACLSCIQRSEFK